MARVGFMMDRIMRPFGMNGKSIVPLISGMACAVPSIMASRNIENKKERSGKVVKIHNYWHGIVL
jgi:ferrous iron transport protein B